MTILINEIITNSQYVNFPIEITSKKTNITYLIVEINKSSIFYKEKNGKLYSGTHETPLGNWSRFFLIQLKKLLEELRQGNIWED